MKVIEHCFPLVVFTMLYTAVLAQFKTLDETSDNVSDHSINEIIKHDRIVHFVK